MWSDYALIAVAEEEVTSPNGRVFTMRAEVRMKPGSQALQCKVGRVDDRADVPVPRSVPWFFEDIPAAMRCVAKVYAEAQECYMDMESRRIADRQQRDKEYLERLAKNEPISWKGQLAAVQVNFLEDE